jgi:pyruvate/2-oxoglutarate dehydrogenase complex dihydrolipoamide acyltransferase (E2) component
MKILQEISIQQESVNDDKVIILDLYFKNGDSVKTGDIVLEFETSKSTISIDVLQDGYIYYNCKEGDEINVGSIVAQVSDQKQEDKKDNQQQKIVQENTNEKTVGKNDNKTNFETKQVYKDNHINPVRDYTPASKTIFSKKATLLIIEKQLKESDFKDKDFVNEDDILEFIGEKPNITNKERRKTNKQPEAIITKKNVTIEKISTQKKREIEYLSEVQSYGLNSTVSVIVDVENVLNFVKDMPTLKGSFLPIIMYELARLLKKYPKLNSYFENDSIIYYNDVNLGIAMDMEKGLKVLKMENPNTLSILEIERAILDLSRKYLEDKTTINDFSDITFTITDLSDSGLASFFPLINKNNSAILAISAVDEKLKRVNLSVTFDHRVTEGKYAASFLFELKTRMESYSKENILEEQNTNISIRCYRCHRKLKDNLYDTVNFIKVIDSKGEDQIVCSVCNTGY